MLTEELDRLHCMARTMGIYVSMQRHLRALFLYFVPSQQYLLHDKNTSKSIYVYIEQILKMLVCYVADGRYRYHFNICQFI